MAGPLHAGTEENVMRRPWGAGPEVEGRLVSGPASAVRLDSGGLSNGFLWALLDLASTRRHTSLRAVCRMEWIVVGASAPGGIMSPRSGPPPPALAPSVALVLDSASDDRLNRGSRDYGSSPAGPPVFMAEAEQCWAVAWFLWALLDLASGLRTSCPRPPARLRALQRSS